MKTKARRRLSGLARLSLVCIVALTLAMPYSGALAYANEQITNALRNTDLTPVAYSSNASASLSLDEAKAALDSANQNKADAAASKDEAQKALDEATAQYNEAESAHSDAAQAANAAKADADKAVGDAISAKQAEVEEAEARYDATYQALLDAQQKEKEAQETLKKAQDAYVAASGDYDTAIKNVNDYALTQAADNLDNAEKQYNAASLKHSELLDAYEAATKARDKAKDAFDTASSKVTSAEAAVTSANNKVTQASTALQTAQSRLDAAGEADDAERERLQGLVTTAQGNLSAAQSERTAKQGALESARSEQATAQSAYDDAVAALETAKANADSAGANLDALKKAADDAKIKSDQAQTDYNNAAAGVGNPGSYADAQSALTQAQTDLANAQEATRIAKQNYDNAAAELAAITGGSGENQGGTTGTEISGNEGSSELASTGDSSSTITTQVTQDEVDRLRQIWQDAITAENGKQKDLETAQTRFDNASSIKSYEDARDSALAAYQSAQREYEAALNGSSSTDLSYYEQQVTNTKATLDEKNAAVTELENELDALERRISTLENEFLEAQHNVDNFTGSDKTLLIQAVEECEAEFEAAETAYNNAVLDREAAMTEKRQAEELYRNRNTAVQTALNEEVAFRDGELNRTNEAVKTATTVYKNALAGLTDSQFPGSTAAAEIRKIDALKNKADALNREITSTTANIPRLNAKIDEAQELFTAAGQDLQYAEAGLERAKALDIENVINAPYPEGHEFFTLNEVANNLATAREAVKPLADNHETARVNLENARNMFATASAELDRTTAEADAAQKVYDDLLAAQNGTSNDEPDVYTPSNKPAAKPAVKKADSNGKATVRTADKKTPAKDEAVAEQTDEQAAEETVIAASQEQRTPVQAKAWTFFGVDPLIAGIVGGAILIAAAAAIAAAVIRHRRNTAEVAESDE